MCDFQITGNDTSKAQPVVVSSPADLAKGLSQYRGMLVQVNNVTADNWADGGVVGAYGVMKLQGSGLEIHDSFYYKNATNGGAPQFSAGQTFTSIVGINHLDYCTWVLQPRDKCSDFNPKSTDCK
jgi:hypothetical protein